jgi:hypothetical protein
LIAGEWMCGGDGAVAADAGQLEPIEPDWSTSFENQFCDYAKVGGFCYAEAEASYTTVESPVHSGRHAAAFTITRRDTMGHQTRCVRQGVLPAAAYYGAWYFVPERADNAALWNLLHFQGGDGGAQHGLWDVSLENTADGELEPIVFDFLNSRTRRAATPKPIPLGAWFHLEFYLERAADASGSIALYQDGELVVEATGIKTDDTRFGQWYVGNLATGLTPPESTVYVDDVTIRRSR